MVGPNDDERPGAPSAGDTRIGGVPAGLAASIVTAVERVAPTARHEPRFDGRASRYGTVPLPDELHDQVRAAIAVSEAELTSSRVQIFTQGDYVLPTRGAVWLADDAPAAVRVFPLTSSTSDGITVIDGPGVERFVDHDRDGVRLRAQTWWWVSPILSPLRVTLVVPDHA